MKPSKKTRQLVRRRPRIVWEPKREGYFLEPVFAWFGPHWQPQADLPRQAFTTQTSETASGWKNGALRGMSRSNDERITVQRLARQQG